VQLARPLPLMPTAWAPLAPATVMFYPCQGRSLPRIHMRFSSGGVEMKGSELCPAQVSGTRVRTLVVPISGEPPATPSGTFINGFYLVYNGICIYANVNDIPGISLVYYQVCESTGHGHVPGPGLFIPGIHSWYTLLWRLAYLLCTKYIPSSLLPAIPAPPTCNSESGTHEMGQSRL
jgi:hypothetical protein